MNDKKSCPNCKAMTDLTMALYQYIDLIGKELHDVVFIAHNHGWRSARYEDGMKMRSEINRLRVKCIRQNSEVRYTGGML